MEKTRILVVDKAPSAVHQRATQAGAKAVLLKPINEEELLITPRNALER
jgi:AmiR/NasT family two-component response regulator